MEIFVFALVALSIFFILVISFSAASQSGWITRQRLDEIRSIDDADDDEMKKPFVDRALLPVYSQMTNLVSRFTPRNIKERYQETLLKAGLANTYTPVRILLNQVLLGTTLVLVFGLLMRLARLEAYWFILLIIAFIGFYFPWVYFERIARIRQDLIRKSLPDFLDMLYVSVEAGLGFDSAMKKTASKKSGPLSQEINRAMDDISKGRDREEALRSIGNRTQIEDVSSFITAVIQSEQLGSNIANMLRIQSRVMREKRRQRAEELAMKIPLKMLFPMLFFLFPALFIVLLGPAAINVIKTLSGM